jgi:hypothetical protein
MNETINLKAIDRITSEYYDLGGDQLLQFKSLAKRTFDNFNINAELFDVLFIPGTHGCSILHYFVMENKYGLFEQILDEYKEKFKLIPASQWEFMLMEKDNDCHKSLIKFYDENYFQQILKSNLAFVSSYSEPSFKEHYLNGSLDNFYKIENLKTFDNSPTYEMVQALSFFDADREGFKSFMLGQSEKYGEKKSLNNYKYECLIYATENEKIKKFKDGKSVIVKDITLNLPDEEEVDILINKWGITKTSQVISEYLKFQKEYTIKANKNNLLKVNFVGETLNRLIKKKIDFSNCGEALCFGLKNNSAHLAYFIINVIISKDNLLMYVHDKQLKREASYHILNESLDKKTEATTKKLKL